jgi:hypothetical protein
MKFKRMMLEYLKRMVAAAVVTKIVDAIMSKIGRSDEKEKEEVSKKSKKKNGK